MDEHSHHMHSTDNLKKVSFQATLHCLMGCALGEVTGMIIATALGWGNAASIFLSILLAFVFGISLTARSLIKHNVAKKQAFKTAFFSDVLSIATMEIVDSAFLILVPGALMAGLSSFLFWWSLGLALVIAGLFAWPVNYYLIKRGKGHALVHEYH